MFKSAVISTLLLAATALGQQEPTPQTPPGQPQVRMNYLNVCAPSAEEQAQIKNAFAVVRAKPVFIQDFEIARGLATLKDAPTSRFVRLRRDLSHESPLLTAQYSMSADSSTTIEILVLRMRDPKGFHELSLEDRSSSGAVAPLALLTVDTPVIRIRVERLGKSSVVLARCEGLDQGAYEALFRQASEIMAQYRKALELGSTIRSDVAWLAGAAQANGPGHSADKNPK